MFRYLFVAACLGLAYGRPEQRILAVPKLDGRIVGGAPIDIEHFPHQVSLRTYGGHICGGSLISPTTVLTAAHCTDRQSVSSLSIRAGSSFHHRGGQVVQVVKIYQHPKFNPRTIDYDVSVLKLEEPVSVGPSAKPIELPELDTPVETEHVAMVSGWGALTEGGGAPSKLQYVNLPIITNDDCAEAYWGAADITSRQICAGHLGVGGQDSCQGDSGGPLVQNGVLVGVVSWGFGCARPEYPGVYAKVSYFRDFIDKYL